MQAQAAEDRWNELRSLPFPEDYPTEEAADRLHDEMLFHRATQVVGWSLPAMTLWCMKKGSEAEFGAGSSVLVIWHRPLTDVGYMGPDKDEGGKYLILPPDYEGETPEGYYSFKRPTFPPFSSHFLDTGYVPALELANDQSHGAAARPPILDTCPRSSVSAFRSVGLARVSGGAARRRAAQAASLRPATKDLASRAASSMSSRSAASRSGSGSAIERRGAA